MLNLVLSTFWKWFLCSLRYCLKFYFSKGVYSFTLSTVPSLDLMFFFVVVVKITFFLSVLYIRVACYL